MSPYISLPKDALSQTTTISQLDLLSPADHEKLLEWNQNYPESIDRLVHEMFQDIVVKTPHAAAVASWDGELTYRELDRLSSRIAGILQKDHNVGTEDIIALCFEKSVWAIVAMIAVLKSGSAFLHIDPKHPPSRHQALLSTTATATPTAII